MMHNKETELLVFWTWKRVPKRNECCFCCYQIFDPLRLCLFSTDCHETSHTLMTVFCIRLPCWIFDVGRNY